MSKVESFIEGCILVFLFIISFVVGCGMWILERFSSKKTSPTPQHKPNVDVPSEIIATMKNPRKHFGITFDEFSDEFDGKFILHYAHGYDPFPGDGFKYFPTTEDLKKYMTDNSDGLVFLGIYRLHAFSRELHK